MGMLKEFKEFAMKGNLVDICLVRYAIYNNIISTDHVSVLYLNDTLSIQLCNSARKGHGIKESVEKILEHRPPNGDIFLLGSANVGKSSLFKCFLDFLYNGKPKDLIQYPTTSVWPGTTIGLLRYPLRKKMDINDKKLRKQLKGKLFTTSNCFVMD